MRILYCNKYNFRFSGTEAYLFDLMPLMRLHGHNVALFAMADPRAQESAQDQNLSQYLIPQYLVPPVDFKSAGLLRQVRLAAHAIYSRSARQWLRDAIASFRPEVAHVRNIYHHLSPSIFWELKAQRIPVIYHLNDFKLLCPSYNMVSQGRACERCRAGTFRHVISEGCYGGPRFSSFALAAEAYFHKWLRTYEKCVDCFLVPSQFAKDKLIEHGWDSARIRVLPHFQRLTGQLPHKPAADAPILYFGRLSSEKGVDDLLRVMQLLPAVRLRIAGDGPQRAQLESLARSLRLENVEFLGHLHCEQLPGLIAGSRFTVFPSHAYETMGKSILESFAGGRAVVASDLGSRRELVHEGKTGALFPAGDIQRLVAAISFLAAHPEQAEAMGAAARELVLKNHLPQKHVAALTQLYEQLLWTKNPTTPQPGERLPATPPPKLRVAFIGGRGVISKYSGIETYYEEAGQRLAALGHEITIYCRSYFTPPVHSYNGMNLVRLPTIRSKHLETMVHTALSTMHALCRPCDVVHYHALGPALFSFIPRLFGKKTVVTVQGLDWQRKKWGALAAAVLRAGEQAAVRLPNATMVVSQTLQHRYRARYGAETLYVPNGTEIRSRRKTSQIVRWGIGSGNYILFLGRFSPEKNCHLLIAAYKKIETSVKLVLAGGGSHSDHYAGELRQHQSDRIRFLPWVAGPDLDELITNAMLFVLPSDLEGLSLALLDAMGAGVCVLASEIPENCEALHQAGFTFKPGDGKDLERKLRLLIFDERLRRDAARRAQQRARENYLWPEIARQIDQVYSAVAQAAPGQAGMSAAAISHLRKQRFPQSYAA